MQHSPDVYVPLVVRVIKVVRFVHEVSRQVSMSVNSSQKYLRLSAERNLFISACGA